MEIAELWGKGWSLRPEQDPRTMTYVGYQANVNKDLTVMTEDHVKARNTDYCGYAIADGGVTSTKAHALLTEILETFTLGIMWAVLVRILR